ncbi:MAG: response regulator [Pseudomonadota bacterium]
MLLIISFPLEAWPYFMKADKLTSRCTPSVKKIRKILVVDEETGIINSIRLFLRSEGYKVVTAQAADYALAYLTASNPDKPELVITDIKVPYKNGVWFIEKIRELSPTSDILVMVNYGDRQVLAEQIVNKTDAYIQKPFTPGQLKKTISQIIKNKKNSLSEADMTHAKTM